MSRFLPLLAASLHVFLPLQIPEALIDFVEMAVDPWLKANPMTGAAIVLPLFISASALSSGATFVAYNILRENRRPTWKAVLETFLPKVPKLLAASLLAALVIGLGVALAGSFIVFLPVAIYLFAIYLFVPHTVMADGDCAVSVILLRSRRLAHTALFRTVALTLLLLAAGVLLKDGVGARLMAVGSPGSPARAAAATAHFLLAVSVGGVVNMSLSAFYLRLRDRASRPPEPG